MKERTQIAISNYRTNKEGDPQNEVDGLKNL